MMKHDETLEMHSALSHEKQTLKAADLSSERSHGAFCQHSPGLFQRGPQGGEWPPSAALEPQLRQGEGTASRSSHCGNKTQGSLAGY